MTTMTMPTTMERTQPTRARSVSHLMPMVVAFVLFAVAAVASVVISGPMP